jgi:hypothetical protein
MTSRDGQRAGVLSWTIPNIFSINLVAHLVGPMMPPAKNRLNSCRLLLYQGAKALSCKMIESPKFVA